jgi:hypothetical protein
MQILAETGCYADLTLPSAPNPAQVAKINALYECALPLHRRAAHRRGRDLRRGRPPETFPLIVQGPLGVNFARRIRGWSVPGIENGALTQRCPPSMRRLGLWRRAAVAVRGRPDWLFIKLHCHGMDPRDKEAMVGIPMAQFLRDLTEGARSGDYRVVDALSTLAFNYPPRATFFRSELENFLLFTREQGYDPLTLTGSYAGAMGVPQFMPSSFRRYAVDFSGDGRIDIWKNLEDVIGSVANYLKEHGWESGQPIAVRASVQGDGYNGFLDNGIDAGVPLDRLELAGVRPIAPLSDNPRAALLALQAEGGEEYWVTLKNFAVIRRYNRSAAYAMAVYQLAEAIRADYLSRATPSVN